MSVTDLTGTTWVFNDVLDLDSFGDIKYINFIYNEKNFIDIRIVEIGNQWFSSKRLQFTGIDADIHQPYGNNNHWGESIHKTIQISGGTDATNSSFISWLEANATQVLPTEPNRLYIKCNGNNHPQVKILTGQTNTKRLYAKIKTKDLINFTIAGVSYQAEEGMTWEDWVNSSYSTNGFFNDGYNIFYNNVFVICKSSDITNNVEPSEIIISDSIYYLVNTSGGLSI